MGSISTLGRDPLEKEMATHSSTVVWENPWTEEPGGLQSMGLQKVGHDLRLNNDNNSWVQGSYMLFVVTCLQNNSEILVTQVIVIISQSSKNCFSFFFFSNCFS